ncbi:hypothetical protein WFZ85_11315 [Flavobacterium sp. j3]|uniref:DUF4382 domain-containing protein n=1 Tax=Flavobacterium aureirubrum TaxID=3133147 RepID=A0ABU9N6Z2_9FLAO
MKNLKTLFGLLLLLVVMWSCSNDENASTNNQLRLKASATYSPSANRSNINALMNNNVVLSSFKINIKEIEFEFAEINDNDNDDSDDNGFFDGDDEFELNGPFELDLLNQSETITTVTIPNGTYEEVEFSLDKSNNSASSMNNKSIEIRGTINGTPFIFWHDIEEEFEIDYEDANQNLVINNNSFDLVFNFDLNQVLSQVDLSNATDNDGDGIIEINPNDTDGNQSLADLLKDKIEDACDLDD